MVATVTFDPVTNSQVTGILEIFTSVYQWFLNKLGDLLSFCMSNPYLVISLAKIVIIAKDITK